MIKFTNHYTNTHTPHTHMHGHVCTFCIHMYTNTYTHMMCVYVHIYMYMMHDVCSIDRLVGEIKEGTGKEHQYTSTVIDHDICANLSVIHVHVQDVIIAR